uniref:(northern house mosquito) hypothetical protein n=1 Tax=Culex pipiens TaxID=7175 RepID=A0A8D8G4D0_CULPI
MKPGCATRWEIYTFERKKKKTSTQRLTARAQRGAKIEYGCRVVVVCRRRKISQPIPIAVVVIFSRNESLCSPVVEVVANSGVRSVVGRSWLCGPGVSPGICGLRVASILRTRGRFFFFACRPKVKKSKEKRCRAARVSSLAVPRRRGHWVEKEAVRVDFGAGADPGTSAEKVAPGSWTRFLGEEATSKFGPLLDSSR